MFPRDSAPGAVDARVDLGVNSEGGLAEAAEPFQVAAEAKLTVAVAPHGAWPAVFAVRSDADSPFDPMRLLGDLSARC